jgi:predicted MFS family arabinose efflux permease
MDSRAPAPASGLRRWWLRVSGLSRDAKLYLGAVTLLGIGNGAAWVHLNLWYRAIGLREDAIGTQLSLGAIGATLVAVPAALWVGRVAPGTMLAWTAVGYALALGTPLLWPHPWLLASGALLSGALYMVHWVVAAPFFMRTARAEDRPDLFGLAHAVETAATLVAAWAVGRIAALAGGWLGSERDGLALGLGCAALAALASAPLFAQITLPADAQALPDGARAAPWWTHLRPRHPRLVWRLTLPAVLVGLGAGLIIPFMNLYFRDRFRLTPQQIGDVFAAGQVWTTAAFLLGPAMARRTGAVAAIVGTELASIPFFLMLAFSHELGWAVAAFWIRGALMQMNQPISSAFALELVPAPDHAVTNSYRQLGWNVAWMASTQLGGVWIAHSGFTPPILAAVALYVCASVSFGWFFGGRRGAT